MNIEEDEGEIFLDYDEIDGLNSDSRRWGIS